MSKTIKTLAALTIAAAAVTPVAAQAQSNAAIETIVVSNNGQLLTLTASQYNLAIATGQISANPGISHIVVSGKTYTIGAYNLAVAINGADKALAKLVETGTPVTITTTPGKIENGQVVGGTPVTGDLKVESVSAINANQVKVVFNKEVDKASAEIATNYSIKKNGSVFTPAAGHTLNAKLQADNKTVILTSTSASTKLYATYEAILANGNSYQVTVENVTDKNYLKLAKSESEVKAFIDSSAPTVTSAEYVDGKVKVHFNEPVDPTVLDYKVDGGSLNSNGTGLTSKVDNEKYYVEFTPTNAEKATGKHTITLYDIQDSIANKSAVASVDYTVSTDTTAPSVVSVTADGMYTFKVKFSEALAAGTEPAVVVKKGALELVLDNTLDAGGNGILLDTTDSSNTTYIVKVKDKDSSNKVYSTGETSVNLSVNVKGYTDAANLAGAEYNGSVTLSKDATPPTVVNAALNKGVVVTGASNDKLNVVFNKDLDVAYSTDGVNDAKITVKKDGITLSSVINSSIINDADGKPRVAEIELGADLTPGIYTIEFAADAVADKSGNKNATLSTTVNYTNSSVFVPVAGITTPSTNVFQVAYTTTPDMTDSAEELSNYTLDGAALPTGTKIGFYGDKKTVRITLPAGSYAKSSTGLLKVDKKVVNKDGVKVLASVGPEVEATGSVTITDNVKPTVTEAKYLINASGDTTSTKIKVTFSENLAAVLDDANSVNDFKVVVNGVKQTVTNVTDGTANDKEVTLTLSGAVNTSQAATINIVAEADQNDATAANNVISVTDVALNKVTANSSVTTTGTELNAGAIADAAVAQGVINQITAATGQAQIEAARSAYAALTVTQKALVTNEATTLQVKEQNLVTSQAGLVANTLSVTTLATKLPTVPTGFTIAVKTTSAPAVYTVAGVGATDGTSTVVYTVTHTASGKIADTGNVTVTVAP